MRICVLVCSLLLLALPAAAQMAGGDIVKVFFVHPKPGMTKEFEAALKKHMEWHAQQKDTWTWLAWQTIVGEGTGSYGVGTFDHHWADFDNLPYDEAADAAHAAATFSPTVERVVPTFWRLMKEVSSPPDAPPAMSQVYTFHVKVGEGQHFDHLIKKFHEAIQKTKWPVHYEWYQLLVGGQTPQYVLVIPHPTWASFKPLDKPFPAMLEEAFGRMEATHMLEAFSKTIRSEESEVVRERPDLGYTPPK
ncbi:MAG: hypothetical protein ACRD4D_02050 [Candidatus Acidiferrales bacterium]